MMICPNCASTNTSGQVFQENTGSKTVSHTRSKYKSRRHGLLWWVFIGWWWWFFKLCFFPILLLFRRPWRVKGKSTTVSNTTNKVGYSTVFLCNDCGYRWNA